MTKRLAILGSDPLFESRINVVRPSLHGFEDLLGDMAEILQSGSLTKGKHLTSFEEALAKHLGVKHAIAVSSATTGLMLVYQALALEGDVVVPSFTFMATVSALRWLGLRPVFADINGETANLDPAAAQNAITSNTSAIVAVHTHGNPADVNELMALADRRGISLIFDAAHAFGSLYCGQSIGPIGNANIFSLSPTKLLVAGEGGVVATNEDKLAEKIKVGREYGNSGNYDCSFPGLNGRLPEFNALLGQHNLRYLEGDVLHRNRLAKLYRDLLAQLPGISFPVVRPGNRNSYKDFSVSVEPSAFGLTRDELAFVLAAENIETRKYYHPPVHLQTAYRQFAPPDGTLPETEILSAHCLSLPIWSHMDISIAERICAVVQLAHEHAVEIKGTLKEDAEAYA